MVMMLCSLVDNYGRSEGTCCLHRHCRRISHVIKSCDTETGGKGRVKSEPLGAVCKYYWFCFRGYVQSHSFCVRH
jgi:hypothetical protein